MSRSFRAVLAVLLAAAALPAAASAGTYTVHQCDYAAGNGFHDFRWHGAGSPAVAQYAGSGCAEFGLAARNGNGGVVQTYPSGGYGGWFAYAPEGTVFTAFSGMFGVLSGCCVSGMTSYAEATEQPDGSGARAYLFQGELGNPTFEPPSGLQGPVGRSWSSATSGFGARRVGFHLRCGPGFSCQQSKYGDLRLRGRSFDFTLRDDHAPIVGEPSGPLLGGGWLRGAQSVGFPAYDVGGGLTRLATSFDDGTLLDSPSGCTIIGGRYAQLQPCPSGRAAGWTVDTTRLPDGERTLTLLASDPGGATTRRTRTLLVDNTAPAAPLGPAVAGGSGWRRDNGFVVGWSNPGGQHAPIVRARFRVCPAGNLVDGCFDGERAEPGVSDSGPIALPRPGEWDVRVWLEDAAGNADPANAAPAQRLRWEPNPSLAFAPAGPGGSPRRAPVAKRPPARVTIRVRGAVARRTGRGPRARRWGRSVRRLTIRAGRPVLFHGRVGRPLPRHGKLVEVQAHFRGRWRTISTVRAKRGGRWRFAYRFGRSGRTARYRLRARVPVEGGYPFAAGASRAVRVTVPPR